MEARRTTSRSLPHWSGISDHSNDGDLLVKIGIHIAEGFIFSLNFESQSQFNQLDETRTHPAISSFGPAASDCSFGFASLGSQMGGVKGLSTTGRTGGSVCTDGFVSKSTIPLPTGPEKTSTLLVDSSSRVETDCAASWGGGGGVSNAGVTPCSLFRPAALSCFLRAVISICSRFLRCFAVSCMGALGGSS